MQKQSVFSFKRNFVIMGLALNFLGLAPLAASEIFIITDFGVQPDSRENAVSAVKKAIKACAGMDEAMLVFAKGRYDFFPDGCTEKEYFESNTTDLNPKRCPILIENMKNLTIDGSGSDFIFHGQMQPLTVDNSKNITIKNVNIDWDVTLTAQGEVIKVEDRNLPGPPRADPFTFQIGNTTTICSGNLS